jgi:hypothetical protein
MTNTLTGVAVSATVAIGAIVSPTAAGAQWRHHHHGFPVAPVIGGLAAGPILGAALAAPPRVGGGGPPPPGAAPGPPPPPPYYYAYAYEPEPVYVTPRCYFRQERFWDGWRWRIRRIDECY